MVLDHPKRWSDMVLLRNMTKMVQDRQVLQEVALLSECTARRCKLGLLLWRKWRMKQR